MPAVDAFAWFDKVDMLNYQVDIIFYGIHDNHRNGTSRFSMISLAHTLCIIAMKKSITAVLDKRNKDTERIIIVIFDVIVEYDVPTPSFKEIDADWRPIKARRANQKRGIVLDAYRTERLIPKCMILSSVNEKILIQFW